MLIYGVLMCGGKGTRIKSVIGSETEKPLIRIKNKPFIVYLINALNHANSFEKIFAAVSNNTQKTREFLNANFQNKIVLLETAGIGYSEDYLTVIKYFKNTKFEKEKEKESECKKKNIISSNRYTFNISWNIETNNPITSRKAMSYNHYRKGFC